MAGSREATCPVERIEARAFRIPTDAPESDGTIAWDSTTLVLVEVSAGGKTGLGYSYASAAARDVVADPLAGTVKGRDAFDIPEIWRLMVAAVRNLGWRGVCACAISAVDVALWDLKAKLLNLPAVRLVGASREEVPIYGSGGFTSYDDARLKEQLGSWVAEAGCRAVKMKIGRAPAKDVGRVRAARSAIGDAELYVDANGALRRKQALCFCREFADLGVTWFEEPVSSDDLAGLHLLRDRAPAGMAVAAGEYGYDPFYFRRMLEAGAVDVLQADATRCAGITGFLTAGNLCAAFGIPFSAHTAPSLHAHAICAVPTAINVEYFFDHYRIEQMFFEGALAPVDGALWPDSSRSGFGLECKLPDMEKYKVYNNVGA